MATKFLDALEKYAKELGVDLYNEAVPGSTNVMTPPVNNQVTNNTNSNASIDDLVKKEQEFTKTTNDVNQRIQAGAATPQDYEALKAATSGLADIQTQKAKLTPQQTPGSKPSVNSLVKPLV